MKKFKKVMSLVLMAILVFSMTLVAGCSKKNAETNVTDNLDKLVVSVGDTKLNLEDVMYYIYAIESEGNYYDQMYQSYFGTGYWNMEYEEGVTMRDMAKDYVIDTAVMYQIFYEKALEAGYTLTEDEIATNKENVTSILEQLSDKQLEVTGFTEENLLAAQEKLALGSKYYDELVAGFDIDEDAIKAGISADDYRQYDTDYMFFATTTTDEEGNTTDVSADDKKAALKNAKAVAKAVAEGKTFDDLKESYSDATVDSLSFISSDDADEAYKEAALKLENDQFSDVVEAEDGYYVIKMTNNNSTESYDAAVETAINDATAEEFDKQYEEIKSNYKVETNDKVWDDIVMGEVTLVADDTADDATSEDATTDSSTTDDTTTSEDATTDDSATDNSSSDDAATDNTTADDGE